MVTAATNQSRNDHLFFFFLATSRDVSLKIKTHPHEFLPIATETTWTQNENEE